jgi:hypothetical protein
VQAHATRLGSRLSFAEAADELAQLLGVAISEATVRRLTEANGARLAAWEAAETARIRATAPPPPAGPACQQVSVDGAMVALVDGTWREVRTLAIGTVQPGAPPEPVKCTEVSYFSRLAAAAEFTDLALGEIHRRGVETAGLVAGVGDGAAWCQTFLDTHCPEAVRILDFPHAAQRLATAAEAVWGVGATAAAWAARQRQVLREGQIDEVLAAIWALPVPEEEGSPARRVQQEVLGYLTPRRHQMRYASFRVMGLPIGSGVVESANKLVVEARLKGAGRRWAEPSVAALLALRGALCSHRWSAAWGVIVAAHHAARDHAPRRPVAAPAALPAATPPAPAASVAPPGRRLHHAAIPATRRAGPPTIVQGRPTARHPWKAAFRPQLPQPAKL